VSQVDDPGFDWTAPQRPCLERLAQAPKTTQGGFGKCVGVLVAVQ
jgi:hypothetical protein